MSDFAKFNATLTKVNFNGKKTVVTFELDNRTAAQNIDFLMTNIDEPVIVNLGDPQMKMDFGENPVRQGISGTIGANGVVESVNKPEGEQEEMNFEAEMTDEDAEAIGEYIDAVLDNVEAEATGEELTYDPVDEDLESSEQDEAEWHNDGPIDDDMDFNEGDEEHEVA
jgi:hypothetical protein